MAPRRSEKKPCSVSGCPKDAWARGWCGTHYRRWRIHGDPGTAELFKPTRGCKVEGCEEKHHAKGYCSLHHIRMKLYGDPNREPASYYRKDGGPCLVEGCLQPQHLRGWCDGHYSRWQRWGDPLGKQPLRTVPLRDKLLSRIDQTESCWEWTGKRYIYGQWHGQPAHRAVYEEFVGPIGDGLHLHHICENKICVNPDHLEPLTPEEHKARHPNKR